MTLEAFRRIVDIAAWPQAGATSHHGRSGDGAMMRARTYLRALLKKDEWPRSEMFVPNPESSLRERCQMLQAHAMSGEIQRSKSFAKTISGSETGEGRVFNPIQYAQLCRLNAERGFRSSSALQFGSTH